MSENESLKLSLGYKPTCGGIAAGEYKRVLSEDYDGDFFTSGQIAFSADGSERGKQKLGIHVTNEYGYMHKIDDENSIGPVAGVSFGGQQVRKTRTVDDIKDENGKKIGYKVEYSKKIGKADYSLPIYTGVEYKYDKDEDWGLSLKATGGYDVLNKKPFGQLEAEGVKHIADGVYAGAYAKYSLSNIPNFEFNGPQVGISFGVNF